MLRHALVLALCSLARGWDSSGSDTEDTSSSGSLTFHRKDVKCAKPLDKAALEGHCPLTGGGRCQSLVLKNVCLVQETFIMFDADGADSHPDGSNAFPDFDVTGIPYWYRHASPEHVDHITHATLHPHQHPSTVLGHQVNFPPIAARFAASHEMDASPTFDECTLPVVVYTHWVMNYGETMVRVPPLMVDLKEALEGASLSLATPLKLPLDRFNEVLLAPFSARKPVSFAELSAVRRHNFSEHEACFSQVVLLKATSGGYPDLPRAADAISAYYEPFPAAPWRSSGNEVTRIVFESRPNKGMRQFIDLDATLASCGEHRQLECRQHTFGGDIRADIALMRETDILVAYHGAGEINSLYMQPHGALLEIRPQGFGTIHGWWPAFWHPMISMQTNQRYFFWGLNVEDPALNQASPQEAENLEKNDAFNARDRFVKLQWDFLHPMLQKIIALKRNVEAYRQLYGKHGHGVVYTWDGKELLQQSPIFCSECPVKSSLECKQC
jgi:hypothetical protein